MPTRPKHEQHVWYRPADIAAMLDGVQHGDKWRAVCPAHGGENQQALGIAQGTDRDGHPMTLLHCFAHACPVDDICAALGITVKNLFCIHPTYAREHRNSPRARSPRIARLKGIEEPSPDVIAQILLEEMIVSDPAFIQECIPARQKMWELAQGSPHARACFNGVLRSAGIHPGPFWATLRGEQEQPA